MALKILDSSGLKYLLSKIKSLLSGKADKSTTLSGYGITNAYTKTETDTAISNAKYTLPNATSSVLGGVKVGTNISVSSGTISVANASTSAKGVVQLSSSTSSTSTSLAATASAVKSAYDLANGKQSPATTLAGYGITDAYTKTEMDTALSGKLSTSGTASKATADASGNNIANTYATKTALNDGLASKLNTSGGNVTGHLYLTGAQESSSTGSTSQIVFGTSSNNHVCISSNQDAIVINEDLNSTASQIVLYLKKASVFPSGIQANVTGNLNGTASKATADASGNNIANTYAKKSTSLSGYGITNAYTKTEVDNLISTLQAKITELESKIPQEALATVATTGSYKDLKDLPTKLNEIKDY